MPRDDRARPAPVPDAVQILHRAVGIARADLGEGHATTARLRAQLTRLLIDLGRDADAAGVETGSLGALARQNGDRS